MVFIDRDLGNINVIEIGDFIEVIRDIISQRLGPPN